MNPTVRDWAPIAASVEAVGLKETGRRFGLSKEAVRSGVRRFRAGQGGVAPENAPAGPGLAVNGRPERRLIIPDAHIPAHDKRAWQIMLAVCRDYRPDRTIIMGDMLDCASLSHHPKKTPDIIRFRDEMAAGNAALDELQSAGSGETLYLEGNHCAWRRSFEAEYPNLADVLSIEKALRLDERGIRWVTLHEQNDFKIGPIAYCHGISEAKHHGMVHAEQFAPSIGARYVTYAHMHVYQHFRSNAGYEATCCGFLGEKRNVAFNYTKGRPVPWSLGFLVQDVLGEKVTQTFVDCANGTAILGGTAYGL
jgi:hypothetical protein